MAEAALDARSRTLEGHLRAIEEGGYSILEDAIDLDFIARLRQRVREIEESTLGEEERGTPVDGLSQLRTSMLTRLDPLFRDVPIQPELLGYSTFNGAVGTLSMPGTNRYATSTFHHPSSLLGREGADPNPTGRSWEQGSDTRARQARFP